MNRQILILGGAVVLHDVSAEPKPAAPTGGLSPEDWIVWTARPAL
jgi:hypothetical protein